MADLDRALQFDPFAGDFGSVGDRALRDKIVRFRKGGICCNCGEQVQVATSGRSLTMLWIDDGVRTYRYCGFCTLAMAISFEDQGVALEARYALLRKIKKVPF